MPTNIDYIKLKKSNVNGVKCKRINVNGVKAWSSVPDYLYHNGAVDGEYLQTMTGSNNWNDGGYGYGGLASHFSLNYNNEGYMRLPAGASAGYGNTYSSENKAVSNVMDLSGASHLRFIGSMICSGAYDYSHWTYIDLIDNSGKTVNIVSISQGAYIQAANASRSIDETVQISNLGLDLTQVRLQLRYGYRHNAPWSNWYGGGGELKISSIPVIS